jgi:flagella basal body P-ring formation protein FlgA
MNMMRPLLVATALFALAAPAALAQSGDDVIASPVLRARVTVTGDLVRVGDLIDNAGSAAQVAVYRAPDLGTTGVLPTAQVLSVLRAHQVIGVEVRDVREVSVTRLARTVDSKDMGGAVARALEHKNGLGDAANLSLTFDREVPDLRLDASYTGAMQATTARFDARSGRFDVSFEIANENAAAPTRLRLTGTAVETVEAAVLTRGVDRGDLLKSSDLVVERRPKLEVGGDAIPRERALGMQMRRPMRVGQPLKLADIVKPDLVQRDQAVTVIYQSAGLYLTTRGKALDGGAEGDVVNVLNLQSKRTVTGVVSGRGQVTIEIATPRPDPVETAPETTASIAAPAGNNSSAPPKAE